MIPWKVSSDSLLRGSALEEGKSYEEKVYDFFFLFVFLYNTLWWCHRNVSDMLALENHLSKRITVVHCGVHT